MFVVIGTIKLASRFLKLKPLKAGVPQNLRHSKAKLASVKAGTVNSKARFVEWHKLPVAEFSFLTAQRRRKIRAFIVAGNP